MSKLATFLGLALVACFLISCITKATEEETKQACKILLELRGEYDIVSVEDAVKDIEEDYKVKETEILDQKAAALQLTNAEHEEKLAKIDEKDKDEADEEKKKLLEDIEKKKTETDENFAHLLERLKTDKENDITEAKEKAAESADEVKTAIDGCVSKSLADGMSQKMALCRANAQTIDKYWNGCGLQ
jgi:DNA anti-recombination protein RmuC